MLLIKRYLSTVCFQKHIGTTKPITDSLCTKIKSCYTSVRFYRNISHGPPPESLFTKLFVMAIPVVFISQVLDFKKIFKIKDTELEELRNYKVPECMVTYSVKPGLERKDEQEEHSDKKSN